MSRQREMSTVTRIARNYRSAARLQRWVALWAPNWVESLSCQLEAEWLEAEADRLDEQVAAYEAARVELLARGAVLAA